MGLKTPIFDLHIAAGAKMVDFSGWDMPLHYGSQIEEHHIVRSAVGVCDVSHMTVIDIHGADSLAFLKKILANDVGKLNYTGKALYSAMLNFQGGVLDDLIVYLLEHGYRLVVNCATREKDLDWMRKQASAFEVEIVEKPELAILAVQGPGVLDAMKSAVTLETAVFIESLKPFVGGFVDEWFIARTGYTGEKGIELILPAGDAVRLWQDLEANGVKPIGLGARDTLRLEAGMNLYGNDMDEFVTPYESNMATTVVMDGERDFIGKEKLGTQLAKGVDRELVGLVLIERGILRAHYPVYSSGERIGEITSGAFSPTLQHSIALARIKTGVNDLTVGIRNKMVPVRKVKPPFVRHGKRVFQ